MRDLLNILDQINEDISRPQIEAMLNSLGYTDLKISGNKVAVLTPIPEKVKKDEFRKQILAEILSKINTKHPELGAHHLNALQISSIGLIAFPDSPVQILVKDSGKQGDQSAGVANEIQLASILQKIIEKYGSADVSFTDERGKKIGIKNATEVEISGRAAGGRGGDNVVRKADVILRSKTKSLPISIKKLDADMWESADNLFGQKAKQILADLQKDKVIKLGKFSDDTGRVYYKLSREIVVEPTEEQAMNAIFGGDLNPEGGVVIQTFKPEHFTQNGNVVKVDCHAVIQKKEDIPESHLMVWLIRNDKTRNNPLPGLRTLGVTLTRGIGRKGDKPVVLVDVNGNVIDRSITPDELEGGSGSGKDETPKPKLKLKDPGASLGADIIKHPKKSRGEPTDLGRERR